MIEIRCKWGESMVKIGENRIYVWWVGLNLSNFGDPYVAVYKLELYVEHIISWRSHDYVL